MNLISVRTGKANMQTASSECFVFYTPRPAIEGEMKVESFIGKAARESQLLRNSPVKEHGSVIVVPSLADMPEDIGGRFATANYQVRDGTILKLYAKKRTGWNGTMRHVIAFLKCREHAAHRMLKFYPVASNALAMDWLGVQGRFDLISLAEAEAFGASVLPMTRKLSEGSDPTLLDNLILEEETLAPVGFVETADGRLMPQLKRRRKIEEL